MKYILINDSFYSTYGKVGAIKYIGKHPRYLFRDGQVEMISHDHKYNFAAMMIIYAKGKEYFILAHRTKDNYIFVEWFNVKSKEIIGNTTKIRCLQDGTSIYYEITVLRYQKSVKITIEEIV